MGTNKEEEKGIWFSHLVLFPALLLWLRVDLSHPHVAIFFSPVFVFVFVFVFHSLYSSANCAIKRANSGVRASGKQQQQNHKNKKIVATRILGEKKS